MLMVLTHNIMILLPVEVFYRAVLTPFFTYTGYYYRFGIVSVELSDRNGDISSYSRWNS